MQVWIASVIIIFALSQFWGWLSHTEFSLSVLGLAGLGLAIASNYDKRHSFPLWPTAKSLADPDLVERSPQPALETEVSVAISGSGDRNLNPS